MSVLRWLRSLCFIFLVVCAASVEPAAAEGRCPPGQYPIGDQGVGGCAPIPGAGQSAGDSTPTGRWEKRWGAIAYHATQDRQGTAAIGVAESKRTEAEARSVALEECRKLGGLECQVLLAYHNQCAALAGPTIEQLSTRGGVLRAAGAGGLEKAKANALRDCQSAEGGQTCILVYSACAVPEFFDS